MAVSWALGARIAEMTALNDSISGRHHIKWVGVTEMDSGDTVEVTDADGNMVFRSTAGWNNYEYWLPVGDFVDNITVSTHTSGTVLVGF